MPVRHKMNVSGSGQHFRASSPPSPTKHFRVRVAWLGFHAKRREWPNTRTPLQSSCRKGVDIHSCCPDFRLRSEAATPSGITLVGYGGGRLSRKRRAKATNSRCFVTLAFSRQPPASVGSTSTEKDTGNCRNVWAERPVNARFL